MDQVIEYIVKNFREHPNYPVALAVLKCLKFIKKNIKKIAKQVGSKKLIRDPDTHMAFHLTDYRTPEEAQRTLLEYVNITEHWLSERIRHNDNNAIHVFLLNISDSSIGCMEARMRSAIDFVEVYQRTGQLPLDELMFQFHRFLDHQKSKENIALHVLNFFAEKVEHQLPIIIGEDNVEYLNWPLIKNYLKETFGIEDIDEAWLQLGEEIQPRLINSEPGRHTVWHTHYFETNESANIYLSYIKSILPKKYQADLAKASIKYDENNGYHFNLTNEQYMEVKAFINKEPHHTRNAVEPDDDKYSLQRSGQPDSDKGKDKLDSKRKAMGKEEEEEIEEKEKKNDYTLSEVDKHEDSVPLETLFKDCKKAIVDKKNNSIKFYFKSKQKAKKSLQLINQILSEMPENSYLIEDQDPLKTNVVNKLSDSSYSFSLSENFFHHLNLYLSQKAERLEVKNAFIFKSLRADKFNYFRRFIKIVTPPFERYPMRKGNKKKFTVTGKGVFKRQNAIEDERYTDVPVKTSQYNKEEKEGFSNFQSATLGLPDLHSPVFGFQADNRNSILVGALFLNPADVLYSDRQYIYDGGTVGRPYEFNDYKSALKYFNSRAGKILFHSGTLEEFKEAIKNNSELYNEALVRLRWNTDGSSMIFIGSDTLEARLLAQDYARIMQEHLQKNNLCPPGYEVPIVFYIPKHKLNFCVYSKVLQDIDRLKAYTLYNDERARHTSYKNNRYEFLLALPPSEIKNLIHEEFKGENVFYRIAQQGYIHIIQALCEKANLDFNTVIARTLDPNRKQSSGYTTLQQVIRDNGSVEFVNSLLSHPDVDVNAKLGFFKNISSLGATGDTPLMLAARLGRDDLIEVLLKHPNIDINAKDSRAYTALHAAVLGGSLKAVQLLLDNGAKFPTSKIIFTPLVFAVITGNEEMIALFIMHKDVYVNLNESSHKNGMKFLFQSTNYSFDQKQHFLLTCLQKYYEHRNQEKDYSHAIFGMSKDKKFAACRFLMANFDKDIKELEKDDNFAQHKRALKQSNSELGAIYSLLKELSKLRKLHPKKKIHSRK